MIKLFRKHKQNSLTKGKVVNYFKYAIGEIILVVIGILIALYINNWNSKRIEKRTAISIYKNIKRQTKMDKNAISLGLKHNQFLSEKFEYGAQIIEENDRAKTDTLLEIELILVEHSDIDINSNIYQNLINSGESKLLKNRIIMEEIQKLEGTYISINRMEKIHYETIQNNIAPYLLKAIKIHDKSARNINIVFGIDFQNYFYSTLLISSQKDLLYNQAIKQIEIITGLIDKEIKQ
ncbi:hypothetical protein BTO06_16040 [Tenacibaculum sp. SZ-18]|uniref:DUF6090 family protein n=1 Tax=Tenacibaculum sp. SZ-18 TaxID=754423 RepID=UPI000C2CF476|nr:DUF6090 family protein [Tenacibaculum sp. SZ-18]AUC16565.1 hypothetical protein BTO06_16040 [Tenacibaculum sp. SZ-18]